MRIVADANVIVSAALGRSPESASVRIIDAALDGRIELVMSPALLAEVADVLSRPRIRNRVSAEDVQLFLGDLAAQTLMFADPADPPSVSRDPDDDYLVALARLTPAHPRQISSTHKRPPTPPFHTTLLAAFVGSYVVAGRRGWFVDVQPVDA